MTKEEIAKDLIDKFTFPFLLDSEVKASAIICAKEIKQRINSNQHGYWDDIITIIEKL